VILIDTHVLLWLDLEPCRLGRSASQVVLDASRDADLGISSMSFWEIGMLTDKNRLQLDEPPEQLMERWLAEGIVDCPPDAAIALDAATLPALHGDPADRFIIATARACGATLMTADRKILGWPGELDRLDATL